MSEDNWTWAWNVASPQTEGSYIRLWFGPLSGEWTVAYPYDVEAYGRWRDAFSAERRRLELAALSRMLNTDRV